MPVPIGRSGVRLFVPDGAVRTQTTVSVERETIDNGRLPAQESSKKFAFAFPNRRELTPGLSVAAVSNDSGVFQIGE